MPPGSKQFKVWVQEQAEKHNVKPCAIHTRLYRGVMKYPRIKKINARVIWVLP